MRVRAWNVSVSGYMDILFAGADCYRRSGTIIIGRLHIVGRPRRIATDALFTSSVRRALAVVRH